MSQCQSFLVSQSSTITSFFTEHSAQLSALYDRSNSSESWDTQRHNMIWTYSDSVKRREAEIPNLDLLWIAVENNTTQVSQLVTTLQSQTRPTLPADDTHGRDKTLPITPDDNLVLHPSTDTQSLPTHLLGQSKPSPVAQPPTPSDICMGCAIPGGTLHLCEDCHFFFHPTCLTEEI